MKIPARQRLRLRSLSGRGHLGLTSRRSPHIEQWTGAESLEGLFGWYLLERAVVANDFVNDEGEECLCECRIKPRPLSQEPESCNLISFTLRVARRQAVFGLQPSNFPGAFKSFRQQMYDRRVKVVDTGPEVKQLIMWVAPG